MGLYSALLVLTVLSLTKGYYKYQMGQLAWTVTICVLIIAQVNSFIENIFNGLFWSARHSHPPPPPPPPPPRPWLCLCSTGVTPSGWRRFLFPVALVICNDSMAYFCGAPPCSTGSLRAAHRP